MGNENMVMRFVLRCKFCEWENSMESVQFDENFVNKINILGKWFQFSDIWIDVSFRILDEIFMDCS